MFIGIADVHPHWKGLFEEKVAFYSAVCWGVCKTVFQTNFVFGPVQRLINYCYNIKFSFSKNEGMPSQEMYKAVNADGQTWCGADEAVWLCSAAFCPLDVTGSLLAVSLSPSAQLLPWEVGWGTCCRQQVECKQGSCPNSELVLC